jgi:hypothetical protein
MDALKLAFDTIIVGVLALPWLAILIDLFTKPAQEKPAQEREFWSLLQNGQTKVSVPPSVVGVVLFSVAYLLGSALSRISGDFFNDEDLRLPFTEDKIGMAVYCDPLEQRLFTDKFSDFGPACITDAKQLPADASAGGMTVPTRRERAALFRALFNVQESSLQQRGSDKTTVLDQLRSQISILRGAALNGFVTLVLCLFGFGANRTRWRLLFWGVVIALVGSGLYALLFQHGAFVGNDPPIMEFTLIVLGVIGGLVLGNGAPQRRYGLWFLLSTLLTGMMVLAWWWTEILYDQKVLHSSFALLQNLIKE